MRAPALAVCLALASAPGWAQDRLRDRFVALVAERGCEITEDEAGVVLPGAGMTMDETEELVETMIARGEATFDGELLVLLPEICTPAAGAAPDAGDPMTRFVAVFAERGCRLSREEARLVLPAGGIALEDAEEIAATLIDRQEATFEDGTLTLLPSVCTPAAGPAPEPLGPRLEARFIAIVAEQDCRITEAEAEAVLPEHGMTIDQTEDFVEAMIDRGEAVFENGTLTLLPAICPPPEAGQ